MPAAFKMYRIVCVLTDKALVSGSDLPHEHLTWRRQPPQWHDRGWWSRTGGTFWKGEDTVRRHLQNLCRDWDRVWSPNRAITWTQPISGPDWTRLQHLRVEQFYVTDYSITKIAASDFMGIPEESAA